MAATHDPLGALRGRFDTTPDEGDVRAAYARALLGAIDDDLRFEQETLARAPLDELEPPSQVYPSARQWAASTRSRAGERLEELRQMYERFPGDPVVRSAYANGIFRLHDIGASTVTAEALTPLQRAHPEDQEVRELYARALRLAASEGSAGDRLARLAALRSLHETDPAHAAVRGAYIDALRYSARTIVADGDAWLRSLRSLHESFPADANARRAYADGLLAAGRNREHHAAIRVLYDSAPDDAEVRQAYASWLCDSIGSAPAAAAGTFLDLLRGLAGSHQDDRRVRESFAKALSAWIARERDDEALDALRALWSADPADQNVASIYARCLLDGIEKTASQQAEPLAAALRDVASSGNELARNRYADLLCDAGADPAASLAELRRLVAEPPISPRSRDGNVRKRYREALAAAFMRADGDAARADLVAQCRALHEDSPRELDVLIPYARMLFHGALLAADDTQAWLDQLRALADRSGHLLHPRELLALALGRLAARASGAGDRATFVSQLQGHCDAFVRDVAAHHGRNLEDMLALYGRLHDAERGAMNETLFELRRRRDERRWDRWAQGLYLIAVARACSDAPPDAVQPLLIALEELVGDTALVSVA